MEDVMTYVVGFKDASNTNVRVTVWDASCEMDAKYQVAKSDSVKSFNYCYKK